MGIIRVEDIRCYAYHGCMDEEGLIGTDFSVNVEVKTNLSVSAKSDELADKIVQKVKEGKSSILL